MWPEYSEKEIEGVSEILKTGRVNQWTGDYVREFEKKFSKYFDVNYSIAINNGTSALELCLKVLNLNDNDEVIVTPRSFVASVSCILINRLKPVFADVDLNSQNITLQNIKNVITDKTRAVICVHLNGFPCEIEEIYSYCKENNIYVIEDCAQSHGAKYNGKYLGSFGDINAWSFCQDKIMSTGGEGGMITTNNKDLFEKAWSFKDHGKDINLYYNRPITNQFSFVHNSVGSNYRMTEIQAYIGLIQLDYLETWIQHRRELSSIYNNKFKNLNNIRLQYENENTLCSYYKYYFFVKDISIRQYIIDEISRNNIKVYYGSCGELYKEKCINQNIICHNSKILHETSIVLLVDPSYSKIDIMNNANIIYNILQKYH
jgi:dTDP-4-amino-4,6-dideoxygalactose transaminase